jgi:hypothetical protein
MRRKPGATIPNRTWDGCPFRIVAYDPGGTTGVATAEWEPTTEGEQLTSIEQIKFNRYSLGPHEHHTQLWRDLQTGNYTDIAWESFEFRQHLLTDDEGNPIAKMKVELISREYIGILRLFCEISNTRFHYRTASSAKRFITPDMLKQVGLWIPGESHKHEMDATRHLTRYMVVVRKIQSPFTDIWLPD